MKINQPGLLTSTSTSGTTTPSSSTTALTTPAATADTDRRPVDTIRSVISSIYSTALNSSNSAASSAENQLRGGAVAPCGAFSMYYASLLLISHGGGVLGDGEWLGKVEGFVGALEVVGRRWRIAGEFFFLLWGGGGVVWGAGWLTGGCRAVCRVDTGCVGESVGGYGDVT